MCLLESLEQVHEKSLKLFFPISQLCCCNNTVVNFQIMLFNHAPRCNCVNGNKWKCFSRDQFELPEQVSIPSSEFVLCYTVCLI